jgi:hypothetical protein
MLVYDRGGETVRRSLILVLTLVGLMMLLAALMVVAQASPLQYEQTLALSASSAAETATGTFTVTAGEADIADLQFTPGPLLDADGNEAVPAQAIVLDPALIPELPAAASQAVTVSISSLPEPGTYQGPISIVYAEQPTGTVDAITLTLTVTPETPAETEEVITPELRIEPEGQPVPLLLKSDGQGYRGGIAVTSLFTGVTGLRLVNVTDLIPDDKTNPAIMGAEHQAAPPDAQALDAGETRLFAITFPKPAFPGTYRGSMEIVYDDKPEDTRHKVDLELIAAMPELTIGPSEALILTQEGKTGVYKATFSVSVVEGEVSRITFSPHELYEVGGGDPILSDKVTVPADTGALGPGDPPKTFTIAVQASKAGTYSGTLDLSYFGTAADKAQGVIPLKLSLIAQPEAGLALSRPEGIKLEAIVGEQQTHTVRIKETTESNSASGLTIARASLVGKENAKRSLPAEAIKLAGGTALALAPGEAGELSLVFDFGITGVQAGEFSGNVTVVGESTPDLEIPIEVTLKHNWPLPMLILALGVFVGLSLTWYQSEQRKKDELLVTIRRLKGRLDQIKNQPDAHNRQFIEFYEGAALAKLDQASTYLEAALPKGVEQAELLVQEVQAYFGRWLEHHVELYRQWELVKKLIQDVKAWNGPQSELVRDILTSLQTIKAKRADYQNAAEMESALDAADAKFVALDRVHQQGKRLDRLLKKLEAEKELESEAIKGFRDRVGDQLAALGEVDDVGKLPAIEAAFDQIAKDLETAFQAYPHFYYEACAERARSLLQQVRQEIENGAFKPAHWQAITRKIQVALDQADDFYGEQMRFETASQLAHNAWRAIWFYKEAILAVRTILVDKDATKEPWKGVLDAVEEIERWLVATGYGDQGIQAFHQQLLVTQMTSLYQKLGQAEGKPVEGPQPDALPEKPYRDLDAFAAAKTRRTVGYAGIRSVRRGISGAAPGRLAQPEDVGFWAKLRDLLGLAVKTLIRIMSSVIGDPRVRILSVEAIASIVTVGALAYWGMDEMWLKDSTFGKNGWLDYFPLLFWGFAANASKDAILKAIKGLGGLGTHIPVE